MTDAGVSKAEAFFGVENFGDPENMEINHHVLQALKAHNIMEEMSTTLLATEKF